MAGLVVSVVPLALGAAVSLALFTVELMILAGTTRPKVRAWCFALGAMAALLAFAFLCLTVLRNAMDSDGGPPNLWSAAIKAVVAVALLLLGLRQLHPRKTAGEKHASRVATHLSTARLPFFVGVGAVTMLTNFSTLVLYIPAMHLITQSSDPDSTKVLAFGVLYAITILPFVLPVLAVSVVGQRSDALLARLNAVVTRHSRQISAIICFVFAGLLIYSAVKQWVT